MDGENTTVTLYSLQHVVDGSSDLFKEWGSRIQFNVTDLEDAIVASRPFKNNLEIEMMKKANLASSQVSCPANETLLNKGI